MPNRAALVCVALCLTASVSWAASLERAEELYLAGDLAGARAELDGLLAAGDAPGRPAALRLLGQLEIDQRNWRAALDAWGELADRHALSPEATAISVAIRPLQALAACGCDAPAEPASVVAEAAAPEAPSAPAPPPAATRPETSPEAAAPPPVPAAPMPAPAQGLLLVGAWGVEYEAAAEVAAALTDFLDANGVAVRLTSTQSAAIHGEDSVLAFLLDEARRSNADGALFLTSRFDFREYIQMRRFDAGGGEIWREKLTGGTALKERRDRGKPNWKLVERLKKRLAKRVGTPGLPGG